MNKQIQNDTTIPVKPIVIGKICSTYGIRGWLRISSFTEDPNSIFNYHSWFIKKRGAWQPICLQAWKNQHQKQIIKLKDIEDLEAAKLLINADIIMEASKLPVLNNGEYYWHHLLGCCVVTVTGYQLGKIVDIMKTGSNDVLIVKSLKDDSFDIRERLIPFVNGQVIKNIDLTTNILEVNWDPEF